MPYFGQCQRAERKSGTARTVALNLADGSSLVKSFWKKIAKSRFFLDFLLYESNNTVYVSYGGCTVPGQCQNSPTKHGFRMMKYPKCDKYNIGQRHSDCVPHIRSTLPLPFSASSLNVSLRCRQSVTRRLDRRVSPVSKAGLRMDAPIKSEHDEVGNRRPQTCSRGLTSQTGNRNRKHKSCSETSVSEQLPY